MYICTEHSEENIDIYLFHLKKIMKIISDCEDGKRSIDSLLKFPVSVNHFGRLN